MPLDMGKLKDLQFLSDFVLDKDTGKNILELKELPHLHKRLCISGLHNIVCQGDALKANISGMEYLTGLILKWGDDTDDWGDCKFCLSFPPLGQLPSLVKLHIKGATVESVDLEFYGCGIKPFRFLNELSFVDMLEWQEWCYDVEEEAEIFPNLGKLTLQRKFRLLPEGMHTLEKLTIFGCPEFKSFPQSGLPPALVMLKLDGNEKLLANGRQCGLQRLNSLLTLTIVEIEFSVFPEEGLLPTSLTDLRFSECPNLTTLDGKGLRSLDSLQSLVIFGGPQLQCLPEEGLPNSLSQLIIFRCPFLERRLQRGKGEDLPKIAHIPDIWLDGKKI
ncbi:hypothetical protein M0R45_036806 [Rubus argutus]|uniref:R13L1/DRL21-like LRR repeat region domain-containing protein n=1 Tax=Rubus argutus TaxID=59490 RepID=A0AAW1VY56_RUBAR